MQRTEQIKQRFEEMRRREGKTTKAMENVTSAIPSSVFLALAGGSIIGALVLKLMGRGNTAVFVGEWAPTFLILGLYNKLVKVIGSDQREAYAQA
jgi:hypothetical protein